MSGIKAPIIDVLNLLSTITVINTDNQNVNLFARIWNNQLRDIKDGKSYEWPRPAAFVEVISPATFETIGLGFRSADLGIRIHLVHEYFNMDGSMEQDLAIFDLRDKVIASLSQYCPTACGPLNCTNEEQDYDHDNLYHYVCEFVCNFIDSKGSSHDPDLNNFDETANPDLDMQPVPGGVPATTTDQNQEFLIIPQIS